VIRATVISTIDQAMLSALNFGIAALLIHYASKEDYGLYSQLVNLQSFFSPLHAGVFVSAYLVLASKMDQSRQFVYRGSMAQAELAITVSSAVLVVAICAAGGWLFNSSITSNSSIAFGCALMGLWWREFVRQTRFANFSYGQALNIDATYCAITVAALGWVFLRHDLTTQSVFWCMAIGGLAAGAPLLKIVRGVHVDLADISREVALSWSVGRWDVLGSFVTWGYGQSYIYFAALHGGLNEAAEVSAGRLLGVPLSLMWISYANVMRPSASRFLADGDSMEVHRLARWSIAFVIGLSVAYSLLVYLLVPMLEPSLFGGKFPMLRPLAMCWVAYFALTGISTVAANLLRSALDFRQVFRLQVASGIAAVMLLGISMSFAAAESLVVAMVVLEMVTSVLFWQRARQVLGKGPSRISESGNL
jgi:O-antigen/teichoic acid export membrane protein